MVLPIAFGAAVAASAAVLKAKCTLVAAGEGCGNQRNKAPGPRASQVDLAEKAEKAQQSLGKEEEATLGAAEQVQLERAMMRAQQEALAGNGECPAISAQRKCSTSGSSDSGIAEPAHRPLLDEDLQAVHRGHRGLHSTGSVFVSSVDSTNGTFFFFGGSTPFKAVLITETAETPQWFKALASKHHAICAFGEARCTDSKFMQVLGVGRIEKLPCVCVATSYPEAVKAWQSLGCTLTLIRPDEKESSLFVFRTGSLPPAELADCVKRMIQVSNTERELHRRLLTSAHGSYSSGTWF